MIINWLKSQILLDCTQFTIDWQEAVIDLLEETANPKDEIGALRYEVENILEIIKPELGPDVEFFGGLLTLLGEFPQGGLAEPCVEHPQAMRVLQ